MPSFHEILADMLATVPDAFDKRQGSIIYDALAPSAAKLADAYIALEIWMEQTYLLTATGNNLDNRAADVAITRFPATNAVRIANMYDQNDLPVDVPIGSRYATPSETGGIIYRAIERLQTGVFLLECETAGTVGNEYYGDVLPLEINNRLGRSEIIGTQVPGRDTETDPDFRERVIERISETAFGGNIADYKRFTKEIDGVGDLKVFPVWNGGGTVLLSVIDGSYDTITPEFKAVIKEAIDPEDYTGEGVGTAPIGHKVTVTTPNRLMVNVSAVVTTEGRTIGQIQEPVEEALEAYFLSIRKGWSDSDNPRVINAAVLSAIFGIDGVINVQNVTLNGNVGDIHLMNTAEYQELPYLGTVTLHEP